MLRDGLQYAESHMAKNEEFIDDDLLGFEINKNSKLSAGGPVLCRIDNKCYVDTSDSHSMIVGDTGSGKTLKIVLPMIYTCAKASESIIISDPKGEAYKYMDSFLINEGYDVHTVNFIHPENSPDKWNPMAKILECLNGKDDGENKAFGELADLFNILFFERNNDKDKYWNESAGNLGLGIAKLMLRYGDKEDFNIKRFLQWRYDKLPNGELRTYYESLRYDDQIRQNLSGYMDLVAENTKSCIISTFDQLVGLFTSTPALVDLLEKSTINMNEIGTKKTAVFIITPDNKTIYNFLVNLFITQVYDKLLDIAEAYGGCVPVRTNFILEEFCNIPRINDIAPMLTAARSRNIRCHLVIQSYANMVDIYGENLSKTIFDNCSNLIYLHSRELSFLQDISKLVGKNEYGRPLLSVPRLQCLKKNEALIFHDRCFPYLAHDIPLIFEYNLQ